MKYYDAVYPSFPIFLFPVQQLQHIPIEMGSPIIQCSVADPYILIMSDEGQLMMLTLKLDAQGGRLVLSKPLIASVSQILLVSNFNFVLWRNFQNDVSVFTEASVI